MKKILTELITKALPNHRYNEITEPFIFHSEVLKKYGYDPKVVIMPPFVCDNESVPIIPGRDRKAGPPHDYLYRSNSIPTVPKHVADEVYLEILVYVHKLKASSMKNKTIMDKFRKRRYVMGAISRRRIKYWAVKYFGKSSYHKFTMEATYEELTNS